MTTESAFGAPSQLPLVGGLIWTYDWSTRGESAYSFLAKLGTKNYLSARDLCRSVFGLPLAPGNYSHRHPRELLHGRWMQNCPGSGPLSAHALTGVISQRNSVLSGAIATSDHLRYCARCLASGFHHPTHQIEAIQRCPFHHVALQETCTKCGAKTPRYALIPALLDTPFQCPSCSAWYAGYFCSPTDTANEIRREGPDRGDQVLQWVYNVERIAPNWPNLKGWVCSSEDVERYRRIAVLQTLRRVEPLFLPDDATVNLRRHWVVEGELAQTTKAEWGPSELARRDRRRAALYKAFRRWLWGALELNRFRLNRGHLDRLMTTEPPLGIGEEFATDNEVKAFAIWRNRFENRRDIVPGERAPKTILRLEVSRWPVEAEVTDATWLMFCALCFLADLDSANQWSMGILHMEPRGAENPNWIALLNEIRPKVVPELFPLPPHLTYTLTPPERVAHGRLWISICSDSYASPNPEFCSQFISSTSIAVKRLAASQLAARDEIVQTQAVICVTPETVLAVAVAEPARLFELKPSTTLDGSSGTYRMPTSPLIPANNDLQAIRIWLGSYDTNPQTRRAFTNAIEKLVNWAYVARGKPVSSLDKTDFFAFEAFLSNPQPTSLWIKHPNQKAWRPFRQPLSPQSIRFVMDVVRALFAWQNRMQYSSVTYELQTFMTERPRASSAQTASEFERGNDSEIMKPAEIECLWRAVEQNPDQCPSEHELIAKLSFYGMLSIPEIQQLRCSDVGEHENTILLFVRRRRLGRQSTYVVPPLAEVLLKYLKFSNMRPVKIEKFDLFPEKPGPTLLGLSQATVRVKLRHALNIAANVAESEGNWQAAKRLPKIGTRALKRTFAAQLTTVGADKWLLFGDVTDISNTLLKHVPERGFLSKAMVADRFAGMSHLWPEEQTYSLDGLLTEFTKRLE